MEVTILVELLFLGISKTDILTRLVLIGVVEPGRKTSIMGKSEIATGIVTSLYCIQSKSKSEQEISFLSRPKRLMLGFDCRPNGSQLRLRNTSEELVRDSEQLSARTLPRWNICLTKAFELPREVQIGFRFIVSEP